ncbi:tektin-1 isoform X2 [Cylas formicarius]|uniref:tektin-1 isoform X2 n=1 Tax=Cylas formicarius TaxID=197179 RepID=UPI002958CB9A|nr:tektin-1 isoform X2 [Cylas formicarius]
MESLQSELKKHSLVIYPPPPARYSLTEWHLKNRYRERCCLDQQKLANSIIAEADRLKDELREKTDLNKKESDQKIEERKREIEFNTDEIKRQRKDVCIEIESLKTHMQRIQDCQNAIGRNALEICRKCIILREGRIGIDMCYDDVERELKRELEVIEGTQKMLQRALEQANEQVRRLKSTKYFMDRDLEDKERVFKIDCHNSTLRETSLNLSIYHGLSPLNRGNITLEEWEEFTKNNIEKAAKEINSARHLCSYTEILIKQAVDDLRNQCHAVNEAFKMRIDEIKDAKRKMEVQHCEIVKQVNEITKTLTGLEKSLKEKEGYMALAHTRLGNRVQRPGMELCKDFVEISLSNEVAEIRRDCAALQHMLAETQASLRYLLKTQIQLEEDLNVKTNSLKIDEVDCMALRQNLDYHAF